MTAPPPLTAILAATAAARSGVHGLTHAALTELCTRPPGTPPSQCRGSLEFRDSAVDSAQAGEGDVGTDVTIDLFRCGHCHQTLVVAIGPAGWRLRNEYDPERRVTL